MGKNKMLRSAQQKGVKTLAWLSFGLAVVGGAFAAETFVGDGIEWVLEHLPWPWLAVLLLIVAIVGTAIDLFIDLTPNYFAIYSMLAAPSVATGVDGKLGDTVSDWANAAQSWVNEVLTDWTGTQSAVGLTLACVVASLLMARRVVKKSAGVPAGA